MLLELLGGCMTVDVLQPLWCCEREEIWCNTYNLSVLCVKVSYGIGLASFYPDDSVWKMGYRTQFRTGKGA
jgi:hypothetical protein